MYTTKTRGVIEIAREVQAHERIASLLHKAGVESQGYIDNREGLTWVQCRLGTLLWALDPSLTRAEADRMARKTIHRITRLDGDPQEEAEGEENDGC